jgi:hypothetical protein
MTTAVNLDSSTAVVKVGSVDLLGRCAEAHRVRDPAGLVKRIEWILKHRGFNPTNLAKEAGLTDNHVWTLVNRLKSDAESGNAGDKAKRGTSVTTDTIDAIARAGRVSFEWLATGRGAPEGGARGAATLGDLGEWAAVREAAQKAHPELPPYAFAQVGKTVTADAAPEGKLEPEFVTDMARAWYRRAAREELRIADNADADDEIAKLRRGPRSRPRKG